MGGSLGLRGVLPQAGVARLQAQGCVGAAGRQSPSHNRHAALRQPADGLTGLQKKEKEVQSKI